MINVYEKLKIIDEISVNIREDDDGTKYIVKHFATNKFYLFNELQYKILSYLDGTNSIEKIQEYLSAQGKMISIEKIQTFLSQLDKYQFFKLDKSTESKKKRIEMQDGNILIKRLLFVKVRLMNPDKFITALTLRLRFLFTKVAQFFLIAYIMCAFYIFVNYYAPWKKEMFYSSIPKNISIFIIIYIISIVASFTHELAHGCMCKKFGGEIREIGFLLIYFHPALYCNISDSYLLKEKSKRVMVAIVGVYQDFLIWSTIIFICRIMQYFGLYFDFIPAFSFVGLISILFELNPLIRLDGYYALTELLNTYNLREESFSYIKGLIYHNSTENLELKRKIEYLTYAFVAGIYSVGLIIYTCYQIAYYLITRLHRIGYVILTVIIIIVLVDFMRKMLINSK